jgi:hypothetical protein
LIRCERDLGNAILEDIRAAYAIDPITWLAYITHPVIAQNLSGEMSSGLFSIEENCFLFDWMDHQVYLGEQGDARSFLDHVRAGWLLPPVRKNPVSVDLKLIGCVDYQAGLVGLLRMTLDQRLRLN